MRYASLVVLVGCTGNYAGDVIIDGGANLPLGEGLTQHYDVHQESCETGYDADGCANVTPLHLSARVGAGSAVELGRIDNDGFDANGVAAGTARIDVTGDDDMTASLAITVMPVDATTLFADRKPPAGLSLPDVTGPALQVFAGSQVAIGQRSVAADHTALAGTVPLELDKGTSAVAFGATCDCYNAGATIGTAHLTAPHGAIDLDVVDTSAIHDIKMDNTDVITMTIGAGAEPLQTFLTPSDAQGRAIVGAGPKPTLTIDDPTIVTAAFDDTIVVGRALFVRGLKVGTTELRITWGTTQLTLVVSVV